MKNKNFTAGKAEKWIVIIFSITFVLLIAAMVLTQVFSPSERPASQLTGGRYDGEWFFWEDGVCVEKPLFIPFHQKIGDSGYVTVGTKITEEMAENGAIGIVSNRYHVYYMVDSEVREEYDTEDTRIMGMYNPVYLMVIRLRPEDAGKTFFMKVMDNGSGVCSLDNVYVGTELGIWFYILSGRVVEVAAGFFLFLVSGSSVLVGIGMVLFRKKGKAIVYIASSVFLISVWSITQSAYRSLLFRNVSIIADVPFFALSLIPVTMLLFFNNMQEGRYRKLTLPVAGFGLVNLWVQFLLHKLEIVDFSRSIYATFSYLFLSIAVIDITIIQDAGKGFHKSCWLVAIGVIVVQVTGIMQVIRYIVMFSDHSSAFVSIGIIFLFITALIWTVQNIQESDRKRVEAENAGRMKEEFLAGMSHEIRTPLNAVLGLNDMIIDTTREPQTLEYAMDVRSAGKSLLSIINDVLDFSKINTGQVELVETEYSVHSLMNDCYNVVNKRASDKKLEFLVSNDEVMPSVLIGDEARIRQIIINILNNAIKYTEKGSIALRVGWVKQESGDGVLKVSVRDTGIGIRGEDRERIYESFTRIDKLKNRKVEGTGLGLAITKKLVDAMGGWKIPLSFSFA